MGNSMLCVSKFNIRHWHFIERLKLLQNPLILKNEICRWDLPLWYKFCDLNNSGCAVFKFWVTFSIHYNLCFSIYITEFTKLRKFLGLKNLGVIRYFGFLLNRNKSYDFKKSQYNCGSQFWGFQKMETSLSVCLSLCLL